MVASMFAGMDQIETYIFNYYGALSDYFNKLSADHAGHLIVVEGGDEDGFFSNIASEKKIIIDKADKIANVTKILVKIYGSKQESHD